MPPGAPPTAITLPLPVGSQVGSSVRSDSHAGRSVAPSDAGSGRAEHDAEAETDGVTGAPPVTAAAPAVEEAPAPVARPDDEFSRIDKNGDGVISMAEWMAGSAPVAEGEGAPPPGPALVPR